MHEWRCGRGRFRGSGASVQCWRRGGSSRGRRIRSWFHVSVRRRSRRNAIHGLGVIPPSVQPRPPPTKPRPQPTRPTQPNSFNRRIAIRIKLPTPPPSFLSHHPTLSLRQSPLIPRRSILIHSIQMPSIRRRIRRHLRLNNLPKRPPQNRITRPRPVDHGPNRSRRHRKRQRNGLAPRPSVFLFLFR